MDKYKVINVIFYTADGLTHELNQLFKRGYSMKSHQGNFIVMELE